MFGAVELRGKLGIGPRTDFTDILETTVKERRLFAALDWKPSRCDDYKVSSVLHADAPEICRVPELRAHLRVCGCCILV